MLKMATAMHAATIRMGRLGGLYLLLLLFGQLLHQPVGKTVEIPFRHAEGVLLA